MYSEIAAVGQSLAIQANYSAVSAVGVDAVGGGTAIFAAESYSLELSIESQVSVFSGQFTDQSTAAEMVKALVLLLIWQMQNESLQGMADDLGGFLEMVAASLEERGAATAAEQALQASTIVDPELPDYLAEGQWPPTMSLDYLPDAGGIGQSQFANAAAVGQAAAGINLLA